jgi:hypothetical protein
MGIEVALEFDPCCWVIGINIFDDEQGGHFFLYFLPTVALHVRVVLGV